MSTTNCITGDGKMPMPLNNGCISDGWLVDGRLNATLSAAIGQMAAARLRAPRRQPPTPPHYPASSKKPMLPTCATLRVAHTCTAASAGRWAASRATRSSRTATSF